MDTTKGRTRAGSAAGYAFSEHTADIGVRAWGPAPGAAFAQAARGMYAIMLGKDPAAATGPSVERAVSVSGETWADRLVNWLAELLFQFSVEGLVAQECDVSACAPPRCAATVAGIVLEDEAQVEGGEIKAVTYHRLEIDIQHNRTTIQVVFDI